MTETVTREEAKRLVKAHGWIGLPLSTLDETYYFDGPQPPNADDVFGDKPDKRPWRMIHKWEGYGPEQFILADPA